MRGLLVQIGQGESLVQFLCPALPNRPHQTVVVVKSGQDGLSQTLYLQKWPKSVFEIVVRVEEEKRSGRALLMVTPMSPLVCRNPAATVPQKQKKSRSNERRAMATRSQNVYKYTPCFLLERCPL